MTITAIKPITIEKFLQLPETEPACAFINVEIMQKSMPEGELNFRLTSAKRLIKLPNLKKSPKPFPNYTVFLVD
jgi:hypothetical protein